MSARLDGEHKAPIYPSIGPAPCDTCWMATACGISELACPEFHSWMLSDAKSHAKTREQKAMIHGKPTKYIFDLMMGEPKAGRPRKAA